MKKIMLIGRTGSGKTTLTQKLNGEEIKYKKTQAVSYKSKIIDTPGEYVENKMYYKSLLVISAEAKTIVLIQAANDKDTLFPPKFSTMFPRKEIIGLITKKDLVEDTEKSERILLEAGATEVYKIGFDDEEGLNTLRRRLGLDDKTESCGS
ncbi:EutP/PduV family microcompartment system protein [Fusobacterium varium]|uniref:EutP/PduV family microcompartment system protein n=1 Tax=Fusobacterium varium TaxID=856 RepID=UPI00242D2EE4|nr:EutP/PduV family microcompartment system protein [Fusobacterium varium]MCI6034170.1 EutP/PduV family microcompartment system protein [Fusobacterium varium]